MTILYIAGPMTGLPENNYPAFNHAETELQALGFRVLNPVKAEPHPEGLGSDEIWRWYMRQTIPMVCLAEGVATLDGHLSSRGARLECQIARELDIPVCSMWTWTAKAEAL